MSSGTSAKGVPAAVPEAQNPAGYGSTGCNNIAKVKANIARSREEKFTRKGGLMSQGNTASAHEPDI